MILLQFIFLLYWKLLCNLCWNLAKQRLYYLLRRTILAHTHTWWRRVLSVYAMPAFFAVWYSSNNDSGKLTRKKRKLVRDETHFWCSAYEPFSIDIAFRLIMAFSLWSVTSSSFSWIFLCELKGVSVLCVNALFLFQLCFLAHWAHSPPPPTPTPTFSLVQRCWCTKKKKRSMFLVLSKIDVKLPTRSTAIRVQSSVSCIFLM